MYEKRGCHNSTCRLIRKKIRGSRPHDSCRALHAAFLGSACLRNYGSFGSGSTTSAFPQSSHVAANRQQWESRSRWKTTTSAAAAAATTNNNKTQHCLTLIIDWLIFFFFFLFSLYYYSQYTLIGVAAHVSKCSSMTASYGSVKKVIQQQQQQRRQHTWKTKIVVDASSTVYKKNQGISYLAQRRRILVRLVTKNTRVIVKKANGRTATIR